MQPINILHESLNKTSIFNPQNFNDPIKLIKDKHKKSLIVPPLDFNNDLVKSTKARHVSTSVAKKYNKESPGSNIFAKNRHMLSKNFVQDDILTEAELLDQTQPLLSNISKGN